MAKMTPMLARRGVAAMAAAPGRGRRRRRCLAAPAVALARPVDRASSRTVSRWSTRSAGRALWGPVLIVAMIVAQTIVAPVPGQVINFVSGYVYGPWVGLLYSWLGMVAGRRHCHAALAAMPDGRSWSGLSARACSRQHRPLCQRARASRFFLLMFLMPGLPDDVLCFVVGHDAFAAADHVAAGR